MNPPNHDTTGRVTSFGPVRQTNYSAPLYVRDARSGQVIPAYKSDTKIKIETNPKTKKSD